MFPMPPCLLLISSPSFCHCSSDTIHQHHLTHTSHLSPLETPKQHRDAQPLFPKFSTGWDCTGTQQLGTFWWTPNETEHACSWLSYTLASHWHNPLTQRNVIICVPSWSWSWWEVVVAAIAQALWEEISPHWASPNVKLQDHFYCMCHFCTMVKNKTKLETVSVIFYL